MCFGNDRKNLGRTPWGLPSAVWAFLWFLSLMLGLILYLIAHVSGYASQRPPPVAGSPWAGPSPASGLAAIRPWPSFSLSYPQPANGPPQGADPSVVAPPVPVAPDPGHPVAPSPPAWHPDPSGRFHYRWWDGSQWTSQVSTDGHVAIDTNPDQRIGPY